MDLKNEKCVLDGKNLMSVPDLELLQQGLTYQDNNDYENMMKYYQLLLDKDNMYVKLNLGVYYMKKDDFNNMMKYLQPLIDNKFTVAMNNLGLYYKEKGDYENMMKYFNMSMELNDIHAPYLIGKYYYDKHELDNMKKYMEIVIEKGTPEIIKKLHIYNYIALYYNSINDIENFFRYVTLDKTQ
jgi:tetratricopeptide (TPR) repeat protein